MTNRQGYNKVNILTLTGSHLEGGNKSCKQRFTEFGHYNFLSVSVKISIEDIFSNFVFKMNEP